MSLHRPWILHGAVIGLLGGAAAAGAQYALGSAAGGALALGIGLAAGALVALRSSAQACSAAATLLARLGAGDDSKREEAESHEELGNAAFDDEVVRLREMLRKAVQVQAELVKAERIARSFWSAMSGPPPVAQGETPPGDAGIKLPLVLERLRHTALAIHRDASSLEELNERIASGAGDQSDAVARTASAVEALSEKIDRISLNSEEAVQACEHARQEARQGLDQVHTVIEGMDRLLAQNEANGRKTKRLEDRSNEIGVIVDLIRGISSRTDMLALNATIESVRAGEHGRGFAVVAEEIRKLAERTATATRDIGTIVEAIQADTHESIKALSQEQTEMQRESSRIRETGSALERISQVAERSSKLVDGISRSTNDQVLATQDLVRAMQRISEVTQQTLERTTQSRSSLKGLMESCGPWQQLAGSAVAADAVPTSERTPAAAPLSGPRRRRELATSESPR